MSAFISQRFRQGGHNDVAYFKYAENEVDQLIVDDPFENLQ